MCSQRSCLTRQQCRLKNCLKLASKGLFGVMWWSAAPVEEIWNAAGSTGSDEHQTRTQCRTGWSHYFWNVLVNGLFIQCYCLALRKRRGCLTFLSITSSDFSGITHWEWPWCCAQPQHGSLFANFWVNVRVYNISPGAVKPRKFVVGSIRCLNIQKIIIEEVPLCQCQLHCIVQFENGNIFIHL